MSAFIVHKAHIDALVTFANAHNLLSYQNLTPDAAGDILACQNYRSVNYRYRESHPTPVYRFRFHSLPPATELVTILKACACYDYQACETPDYERTEAARLVARIRNKAIELLPGWGDAPWGIEPAHAPAAMTSAGRRAR